MPELLWPFGHCIKIEDSNLESISLCGNLESRSQSKCFKISGYRPNELVRGQPLGRLGECTFNVANETKRFKALTFYILSQNFLLEITRNSCLDSKALGSEVEVRE